MPNVSACLMTACNMIINKVNIRDEIVICCNLKEMHC